MSRRDCALRAHFPELRLSRQERSAFERCVSCIHCSTTAPGALTRPSTRDATRRSATATLPPCRTASRPVCVLAALQSARANCARQPPVRAALTQSTLPPRTVDRPPLPARQVPVLLQPACAASQTLPAAAPLRTRLPSAGSAAVREPTGRRAARLSIALQAARSIRINRTWSPDEPHIEATAYELTVSRRPSSCCTSLNRPVDAQVQQRARGTSTS